MVFRTKKKKINTRSKFWTKNDREVYDGKNSPHRVHHFRRRHDRRRLQPRLLLCLVGRSEAQAGESCPRKTSLQLATHLWWAFFIKMILNKEPLLMFEQLITFYWKFLLIISDKLGIVLNFCEDRRLLHVAIVSSPRGYPRHVPLSRRLDLTNQWPARVPVTGQAACSWATGWHCAELFFGVECVFEMALTHAALN